LALNEQSSLYNLEMKEEENNESKFHIFVFYIYIFYWIYKEYNINYYISFL